MYGFSRRRQRHVVRRGSEAEAIYLRKAACIGAKSQVSSKEERTAATRESHCYQQRVTRK